MGEAERARALGDEPYLELPKSRERIADATHFRSTWLTASIASLRERGHADAYVAHLAPETKEQVLAVVAGVWLPMELARSHYTACDRLSLSNAELVDIGMGATRRANATALSFAVRLARGAGVSPWTILAQLQRIWDRTFMGGGGVGVWRLGPKEARVEIIGFPLAGIRYNRVTFRGIITAIVELFCSKVYVQEIGARCDARTLAFRISWV